MIQSVKQIFIVTALLALFLTSAVCQENSRVDESFKLEKEFTFFKRSKLSGRLSFTAKMNGDRQLYEVDLSNGRLRRLANSDGEDWYSDYSATGKQIVFTSTRGGRVPSIHIMQWQDLATKRLTTSNQAEGDPNFHPTPGNQDVAFFREISSNTRDTEIFLINAQSKKEKQITRFGKRNVTPKFSPNGASIAFTSSAHWPGWDVCIAGVRQFSAQCILKGVQSFCRPSWNPDGIRIGFSYGSGDSISLGEMFFKSKKQKRLGTLAGKNYDIEYDETGKYIFFANNSNGNFDIYVKINKKELPLITSPHSLRYPSYHRNNMLDQEVMITKEKGL